MTALIILAAGVGSRFGAPKQLTPVGPHGETILQYNAHDAVAAGFDRIVAVTRPELHEMVESRLGEVCGPEVETRVVLQVVPEGRGKPLGSADAVLAAAAHVEGDFGVANADDIYGPSAFRALAGAIDAGDADATVVAYRLADTVPPTGRVSRALLRVEAEAVTGLVETHGIGRRADGRLTVEPGGRLLDGGEWVSMNLWGLPAHMIDHMRSRVEAFRPRAGADAEIYLPDVVGDLTRSGNLKLRWVPSGERWTGITNPDDLEAVRTFLEATRPQPLWS
ncbi:MAG TPA: NTP transferase domain-containing protein [Acidimicrobiales bacterium]|nr:NTP transferase domain-containing protein [Acidimicrobiales bacterium]